jgi:hypothetical protein
LLDARAVVSVDMLAWNVFVATIRNEGGQP